MIACIHTRKYAYLRFWVCGVEIKKESNKCSACFCVRRKREEGRDIKRGSEREKVCVWEGKTV